MNHSVTILVLYWFVNQRVDNVFLIFLKRERENPLTAIHQQVVMVANLFLRRYYAKMHVSSSVIL